GRRGPGRAGPAAHVPPGTPVGPRRGCGPTGVSGASTAPAVVVRDVPVVAFLVVDVPRGRLPLATADVAERVLDVVVQARRQAGVELVAVPVAVRAAGMAGLLSTGDVDLYDACRRTCLDS